MLALFKPKSAADSEKQDSVPAVESTPVQDAASQSTEQAEVRVSSASVPTIDSTPTIQGPPADPPQTLAPSKAPDSPNPAASLSPQTASHQGSAPSVHTESSAHTDRPMQSQSQSALPYSLPSANSTGKDPRRFSFPSFSFLRPDAKQSKPLEKKPKASRTLSSFIPGSAASSDKRAKESATIVRAVIIGDHTTSDPKVKTKPVSKSDVARVKSQLLDPKAAAKVIAHLRTLPAHPSDAGKNTIPIHAVCLDMPDKDVHEHCAARIPSVATASLSTVSSALADLHLVDLVTAPNMGFGAPVTARGLFAGAVPTAETVIEGIEQITPQLMALGYATGRAIVPDHKGVVVPTDRISVLTYWWGFEICLPPPTMAYLEGAEDPCTALLNLLTAISLLNEGVREILPFVRYIAQFVQSEWGTIKRADKGKGVVCTATWLLPVALVPHPWDFPDPPPSHTETVAVGQSRPTSPSVKRFSATLATPKPSTEVPNGAPRVSSAYSAETRDDDEARHPIGHAISSEPPVLPELVVSSPGSIDGAPPESVNGESHNPYGKVQHDGEAIAH